VDLSVSSPFPFEALPRVWGWIANLRDRISDDFSPQTQGEFVESMAAGWERWLTWAIRGDSELGGLVTFERFNAWIGTAHIALKPDFQGKGMAMPALRTTFAAMFATGIGKLIFYPFEGNLAVGSLLVNLGAKREGCLKGQTLRGGKPIDVWVYGLSKQQFEEKKANVILGGVIGNRGIGGGGKLVAADDANVHCDGQPGELGRIDLPE
jgi:RimJ/RimL family protein N-acetyltransferase